MFQILKNIWVFTIFNTKKNWKVHLINTVCFSNGITTTLYLQFKQTLFVVEIIKDNAIETCQLGVCVCVFIFFHREGFFWLQDVQDMLERYGSTILCCEYSSGCFC